MSFNVKSLVNIPREKKTMEITNAKEGYLVLTKTNSLLYLLPAYLRSTPLVVLVPPLFIYLYNTRFHTSGGKIR